MVATKDLFVHVQTLFTAWQEEQGQQRLAAAGLESRVATEGSAVAGKEKAWGCTRAAVGAVAGEEPR